MADNDMKNEDLGEEAEVVSETAEKLAETAAEADGDAGAAADEESSGKPEKSSDKEKKKSGKGRNPFKSKKFRHGTLSVVFTVIFIAAVVLVNVIVTLVAERFNMEADLTSGAVFTLGDETQEYIKNVDDDVQFFITADKDSLKSSGETLYEQIVEFMDKMTSLNSRFSVRYVNLLTEPEFSNDFEEDLKNYQLIVKSGRTGRYSVLTISDFLKFVLNDGNTYSYSEANMRVAYGGYSITDYFSDAEEQIVSALMSVSKENPTVVTFLTGYGESDSSPLEEILTSNAYITNSEDIERIAAVPEDTDILVIHAPTKDYSNESLTKIDEWLSNNGKFGRDLIYIASPEADETPNIDAFLAEWGLRVERGYVLQYDMNYYYNSGLVTKGRNPITVMHDLEVKTDTDYYTNMKRSASSRLVGYYVRPVTRLWEEQSNQKTSVIVSAYGEQCLLFPFSADENWEPDASQYAGYDIIVEASKTQYEGGIEPVRSKVIAVGGDQLFASYFTTASNYSNGELALTLFDTNSETDDTDIKIVRKSFKAETYQINSDKEFGIGITFAVIIPVVIIIAGIVVWVKRRRL